MAEDQSAINVEIKYLRDDMAKMSVMLTAFMGKQDGRFEQISQTYVRQDVLDIRLKGISDDLSDIKTSQDKIACHVPMLVEIKKERDGIKNQAFTLIGKVLFWIIMSLIGIYAIVK